MKSNPLISPTMITVKDLQLTRAVNIYLDHYTKHNALFVHLMASLVHYLAVNGVQVHLL